MSAGSIGRSRRIAPPRSGSRADRDAGVGPRGRVLRTQRRLTLDTLAAKVGITPSALSQIERDQASPTLGTLKAIASALGITIGQLFPSSSVPNRVVVRPVERKRLSPRNGITYELLTPDLAGQIEFILSVYERGASTGDEAFAYPAEQCGLVLAGIAEIHLSDVVYRLHTGDSIRFDCSIPHRIVNAGRGRLRCLWAISPPTF
jgi:transcriptional regulator with XRE-family HTH domain